jgi:hypothetical protein
MARQRYWLVVGALVAICLLSVSIAVVVKRHSESGGPEKGASVRPRPTISAAAPSGSVRGCAATPSACGYPDASNTGILAGTPLRASGCISSTSSGETIENVTLSDCGINVTSTNVVIRNVRITMANPQGFAVIIRAKASATIDHVEISGLDQAGNSLQYAVLSQTERPVAISHANLFNCADCVQGENVTLTASYLHQLANPAGAHTDGFQCNSSCEVAVVGNTILNQWEQTSTVALFADFDTPQDSTISGNLLAGGGYTIYGGAEKATGIVISNNRFARTFFADGGQYGVVDQFNDDTNKWFGNIWDDTGQPVTL